MMTQRQSAIVLTLFAALYGGILVLFAPELDFIVGEDDAYLFASAVTGFVVAGPAFLALWAVHGRQRAIVRVPLTAWLCSMYFMAVIYGEVRYFGAGESDIVLLLLVAWATAYAADLLLLRLLRAVRGWRLLRIQDESCTAAANEASPPSNRPAQFTIRTPLAWTAAVAALFAGARWLAPYGVFDANGLWADFDTLGIGAVLGSIFALAGLPVVSVALIILADGRRTIWRCVLASLTALGIWGGVSVTGLLLAEQQGDEIVMLALAIETGVLLAGALATALTRACGYRLVCGDTLCSTIREDSGPDGVFGPDTSSAFAPRKYALSRSERRQSPNRRFAFALAPLVTGALLLAGYAPRRLQTWWRADQKQRWESLGWQASLDDEGHITQLISVGEVAVANLAALAPELAPHLKYLQLSDEESDGLPELPPLPNLQTLILYGASDASFSNLGRFPNLETLTVWGKEFTDAGLRRLTILTKLQDLCLAGTGVLLEEVPPLPQLNGLNLRLTDVGDAGLSHVDHFPNLQMLDLGSTSVTDRGLDALRGLKLLTTLNLRQTEIGDDGVPVLAGLSQLRSLDLELTAVSEAGFRELRGGLARAAIKVGASDTTIELAIFGMVAYKQGLGPVVNTRGSNAVMLKHLHARGKHLTEPVAESAAAEKSNTVTDDGLAILSGQTMMEDLDLRDSAVTDAGLNSLAKLTRLKRLDLRGTRVTEDGCQRLAKTLPGCQVLR